jgi:predicted nucleic acid-binding protein
MSDKVFLDTNILVYAHTDVDAAKQLVAQELNHQQFLLYQHASIAGTGQYT